MSKHYLIVRDLDTDEEVHRVELKSSSSERVLRRLLDEYPERDRFYVDDRRNGRLSE